MVWRESLLRSRGGILLSLKVSGNLRGAVTQKYPEDSLQYYCSPWWIRTEEREVRRGRLLWAFVPHVDQHPFVLIAEGRTEDTEHGSADYRFEPLRGGTLPTGAKLPVAGLPHYPGEVRLVLRAKRRPVLVLSAGGVEIPKGLRAGSARYQTNPTLIAAPYYGADQGGSSGGWKPEFVTRIRRCEYPQYLWERLPITGRDESILRLDHLQPIGRHGESYETTEYTLHEEALGLVDEYLEWFLRGRLPSAGIVNEVRRTLLGIY